MLHLLHIGFDTGHPARDRGTIRTNIPTSRNSREGMRQTLYHRYPHSRHSESINRLPATVYDQKSSQNFRKPWCQSSCHTASQTWSVHLPRRFCIGIILPEGSKPEIACRLSIGRMRIRDGPAMSRPLTRPTPEETCPMMQSKCVETAESP